MKYAIHTILLAACLLVSTSYRAQYPYSGPIFQGYVDGSIFGGVSMIKIPDSNPTPGIKLEYETGSNNLKICISFMTTVRKSAGERIGTVMSMADGSQKQVAFESRNGYFSCAMQARYYAFDTEEATGHNFFGGAGLGWGTVHGNITRGKYDKTLYTPYTSTYNDGAESTTSLLFNLGGGYQYAFDSGLVLFSELRYEKSFLETETYVKGYYQPSRVGSFSVSGGIKYIFTYDFSYLGPNVHGAPGKRL